MDLGRVVEKMSKREIRRIERSRLRWLEDVERDLRQMKVKRWRQNVVDREV